MTVRTKGSMGKMEGVAGVVRKADKVQPKTDQVPKVKEAQVSATSSVKKSNQ
jgi:hypothetical protein